VAAPLRLLHAGHATSAGSLAAPPSAAAAAGTADRPLPPHVRSQVLLDGTDHSLMRAFMCYAELALEAALDRVGGSVACCINVRNTCGGLHIV
jgi:hypothetical protein